MKHFLLKFNHGVEIGAYLAYLGHFDRVGGADLTIILCDECEHREILRQLLEKLDEKPNKVIDKSFTIIGKTIQYLCKYAPLWSLDFIARTMELFAIFNYRRLAKMYPQYSKHLIEMAKTEDEHAKYFKRQK